MFGRPTCKFWLAGRCAHGTQCRFKHQHTDSLSELAEFAKKLHTQTGDCLEAIDSTELSSAIESSKKVALTDYEFLASYNWVNKEAPTIYVPGAPPVWNSKELPFKISKDTGISFVDQNAARFSKYPFEPLFRSLAVMQPRFDMKDVDIITDRNSLRKLLHFVSGTVRDPFRINVRLVGGVLFFCRWEPETKFLISGFRDTGFGHNFEKACTFFDPDLKDSSGHHRIVRYKLGGIRCLVRYEADACCGEFKGSEPGSDDEKSDSGDGLLDAFKAMAVTSPDTGLTESVTVVKKGRVVEPSTIVELKSKVAHRKIHLPEVTPQLWFAQTQSLFVGYHNNGRFENVEKVPMGPTFTRWEKDHQHQLQKLVYLIWKLKNLTATSKDNACALVCGQEKPLRMKVYEYLEEGSVLPDSIISQYEWEHANPRQNA